MRGQVSVELRATVGCDDFGCTMKRKVESSEMINEIDARELIRDCGEVATGGKEINCDEDGADLSIVMLDG